MTRELMRRSAVVESSVLAASLASRLLSVRLVLRFGVKDEVSASAKLRRASTERDALVRRVI